MKVLQVVHEYLPDRVGGAEIHAHQLARVLSARGHEVVCLATAEDPDGSRPFELHERLLDGVRVLVCSRRGAIEDVRESWRPPGAERAFRDLLAEEQPDLVHFQHLAHWGSGCISAARELGVATVVSLHDYFLLCERTTLLDENGELCPPAATHRCLDCLVRLPFRTGWQGAGIKKRLRLAMAERLDWHRTHLRSAQRVIASSHFLAEAMLEAGMIELGQLERLQLGTPGPLRPPRMPSADAPLRLGFVGSLEPARGVHVLIEAVRALRGQPLVLEVYGPLARYPEYVADLRSAAQGYPVLFRGRFEPPLADRVFGRFDVLVVPSLWYESGPTVVYEAWRNGLAVVASDVGGLAECVVNGDNGLLVPRGDSRSLAEAIRALIDDRSLVARLAAGRPAVPSVEACAARVEQIYGECGSERAQGAYGG